MSVNFPENGLEIAAEIVNSIITSPFLSAPPNSVMKSLSSGRIKLKLVIKKNMESESSQKFFP